MENNENLSVPSFEEQQKDLVESPLNAPLKPSEGRGRGKTPLRRQYEAEVQAIQKSLGDLEKIREELGLSRRKMCQLLMVDPSSWTRWTKNGDSVPPHIYRALQWYMALLEKRPEWHPQNSFGPQVRAFNSEKWERLKDEIEAKLTAHKSTPEIEYKLDELRHTWLTEKAELHSNIEKRLQVGLAWKMLLLANTVFILMLLLSKYFSSGQ